MILYVKIIIRRNVGEKMGLNLNPKVVKIKNSNNLELKKRANNTFYNLQNAINVMDDYAMNYIYDEINYSDKYHDLEYIEVQNDDFITQGITIIDNKTFISAYTKEKGVESRLYVYDNTTNKYLGYIILDQKSHVGGVTFDEENNVMYVTNGRGNYSTYDYNVINNILEDSSNYNHGLIKYKLTSINNISEEEFNQILLNSKDEDIINLLNNNSIDDIYYNWNNNYSDDIYEKITHIINQTHSEAIKNNINANCTASTTTFHNGLLYQVMKDGIHLNELMRKKPHRIFPKYGIQYYGTTSAKAERQLKHVIRVIEDYIGNSNYEQEAAA